MKKWKIYLVPHTHWDKEWYFIKETSDIYLIDNLKKIMEANNDDCHEAPFVYDGQYSVIDDFLRYYPDKYEQLKHLMENKKLIVGPWYTQTDMFNATGESIIRNLLIGTKLSQDMGNSMRVAYLPDTFGFNSNLPQIAKKSGCVGIIQWRGIDDQLVNNSLLNIWQANDGTEILTYSLYKHGYFTGVGGLLCQYREEFSKNKDKKYWNPKILAKENASFFLNFIKDELTFLKTKAYATNNRILIPVGSDQMPMVSGWCDVGKEMNKLDSDNEWIISTYDDFFSELIVDPNVKNALKKISGEMRYGKYARAHKTINSSRYDIKSLSKKVEYKMYNVVEPLAVMFKKWGGEYPAEILLDVTKRLVSCHAHDSLGGCNTDETNRSILNRLEEAYALLESQETLMKKRIMDAAGLKENELLLFNLAPYSRNVEFNVKVNTRSKSFKLAQNGTDLKFEVLDQTFFDNKNFCTLEHSHLNENLFFNSASSYVAGPLNATNMVTDNDCESRYVTDVVFALDCPALSYQVISVNENCSKKFNIQLLKDSNFVENKYYKITVEPDGTLTLNAGKQAIKNAWSLAADFDAGDTYDFSPSSKCEGLTNELEEFNYSVENNSTYNKVLHIKYKYLVPKELGSDVKIVQDVFMNIVLNQKNIDLSIEINNVAKDIRWRLVMETGIHNSKFSYADQCCAISKRLVHDPKTNLWEKEKWTDMPIEIESMESLVYLKNEERVYPVFVNGTNEYQIIGKNDSKIAVTLFRGVSYIGRRHLKYRPGRASGIDGYPHETPDSNLNRKLNFKLRNNLYVSEDMLNRSSKEWCWESCYYQKQSINPFQWKGDTFVMAQRPIQIFDKNNSLPYDLGNIGPLVITAVKQGFNHDFDLVRLYNPSDKEFTIKSRSICGELNLQDDIIEGISFNLKVKPFEIKSYLLKK